MRTGEAEPAGSQRRAVRWPFWEHRCQYPPVLTTFPSHEDRLRFFASRPLRMLFPLPGTHFPAHSCLPHTQSSLHSAPVSRQESQFRCHFPSPPRQRVPYWASLQAPCPCCGTHTGAVVLKNSTPGVGFWGEGGDDLFLTGSRSRPGLGEQRPSLWFPV